MNQKIDQKINQKINQKIIKKNRLKIVHKIEAQNTFQRAARFVCAAPWEVFCASFFFKF